MATLKVAQDLLNIIYPVGSIYLSTSSTNPSNLFGGTWEQIKDKFLLSAGSTYTAGNTGGSATHYHTNSDTKSTTLSIDQIPAHVHGAKHLGSFDGSRNGWVGSIGALSSEVTESTGGGKGHTHGMNNTGTSSSLPPYLVVYMFKRTK